LKSPGFGIDPNNKLQGRFEQWDIYLAGAAVVVGLAIVIAIVLLL
jgi:hypothetical protein